jgi:hypothetical protein
MLLIELEEMCVSSVFENRLSFIEEFFIVSYSPPLIALSGPSYSHPDGLI